MFRGIVGLRVLRDIVSFFDNFAAIPAFISSFLLCDEILSTGFFCYHFCAVGLWIFFVIVLRLPHSGLSSSIATWSAVNL